MAINTVKIGNLEYLTAQGICAPHCFTTRLGGVSQGHLASLNLGTRRGDDPENVVQNYRILGQALGFAPENLVLTKQTHTDIVRQVGKAHWGTGLFFPDFSPCDALITNEPGTGLVVFTADCTPILLHDPVTGAVGAVHAGWRGTAANIAGKTVQAMAKAYGCRPENIRSAIGPNIAQCCFACDRDVPEALEKALGEDAWAYVAARNGKYYVNLKEVNARFLRNAGVAHIEIAQECTMCQSHRFWSHRVTGNMRGSQGAVIVCKEVSP